MGITSKYYLISAKHKPEIASAYAPEGTSLAHELVHELENENELPFSLELIKLTTTKMGIQESNDLSGLEEVWLDYQPNSLAWPLFSERLKSIVEDNLTGLERIDWLKANVKFEHEIKVYFIPRFSIKLDVLDENETKFVPGTDQIIRPCFSKDKVSGFSIFHKPSFSWQITPELYITEELKNIIDRENLSGISFDNALVS